MTSTRQHSPGSQSISTLEHTRLDLQNVNLRNNSRPSVKSALTSCRSIGKARAGRKFACRVCQKFTVFKDSSEFPYHDIACKTSMKRFTPTCVWCRVEITDNAVLCKPCEDKLLGPKAPSPKGWSQFKMKGAGATGVEGLATSQNSQECGITMDELVAHARVWVSLHAKPVTCGLCPSLIRLR
jgi:hypothetical protein